MQKIPGSILIMKDKIGLGNCNECAIAGRHVAVNFTLSSLWIEHFKWVKVKSTYRGSVLTFYEVTSGSKSRVQFFLLFASE